MKTIDYRYTKHHTGWQKTQHYTNNNRRSGRTKLIIAESITELLSTGSCLIIEHQGTPQTLAYYEKFTSYWFYQALQGLFYDIPIKELRSIFPCRALMDDGYCLGLEVTAKQQGEFQYQTGYEPYQLKSEIKALKAELSRWQNKHQACVNIIERLRSSVWEYIKFRLRL